jgi:hypothetical protein
MKPYKISLKKIHTPNTESVLIPINAFDSIPINIKRFFYIFNLTNSDLRGGHAHKKITQCIISINGAFEIKSSDAFKSQYFKLTNPTEALIVPPLNWIEIYNFSSKAIILVTADDVYDEKEYIRDFSQLNKYENSIL